MEFRSGGALKKKKMAEGTTRERKNGDTHSEIERQREREWERRDCEQGNKQQDQKGEIVHISSHIPVIIIIIIKRYSKNSFIHRSFHFDEERNLLYPNGAISLTVRIYVIRCWRNVNAHTPALA